jgi:hypothetical protein
MLVSSIVLNCIVVYCKSLFRGDIGFQKTVMLMLFYVSSDCSDVAYKLEALKLVDMSSEQEQATIHTLLVNATNK